MKLFQKSTSLITWQQPVLFGARTRNGRGWLLRGAFFLLVFGVMLLAFSADKRRGRKPKRSFAGGVVVSALVGLLFTSMLDATDLNRQITISNDSITSFGNAGHHMSVSTWPIRDVLWVRLIRPAECGRSFGAMEFQATRGSARVGIPATASLARIAEILHGLGVSVQLSAWAPTARQAPPDGAQIVDAPAPQSMPATSAKVASLPEQDAGQILSPFHYRFALGMSLAPLVLTLLVGLGLCGYALYETQIVRARASLDIAAAAFGGICLIAFGFWFTGRLGNLVPSLYLRGVARSVIEARPVAPFDPRDPDLIYIDVIPRANWGKAMLSNFSDTGLLKVDTVARTLLYEGDKERWSIPGASLVSVEIESYHAAGYVEGQSNAETFFVAVIRANVAGQVWEAPISKCHVEFRPKNNQLREANAVWLRDAIRAIAPRARPSSARALRS